MRGIATLALVGALAAAATPAAAENWRRFSTSDRIVYLVDLDTLAAVDGVSAVHFARVPTEGAADNQEHEREEVAVRCSDGYSRTTLNLTFGPDGAETDRYAEQTEWEATPGGGIYGLIKSFACDDMRPQGSDWPSVAAFIAAGRGR